MTNRLLCILLAIVTVLGALLAWDYLGRAVPPQRATIPSAMSTGTYGPVPGSSAAPAPTVTYPQAVPDTARRAEAPQVFKCHTNGRVEYADRPCGGTARIVDTRSASAGLSPERPFRDQLAALPRPAAPIAETPVAPAAHPATARALTGPESVTCDSVDERIRWIDSLLRAAHGPLEGDQLTARRRTLTAWKFDARC
ncbi:MAG: hypothetical protein QM639_20040 [Rhodocyclaceae bacterium]